MCIVKHHGSVRRPRVLILLAGLLVWTSADGDRQIPTHKEPPPSPPPVVCEVERAESAAAELALSPTPTELPDHP